jgi:Mg/Co/Ni transporter MgtE
MLDLNPETVEQIIERAHEYQTSDAASLLEDEDEAAALEEELEEETYHDVADPVYQELKNAIDDLEPDQQVSLVALMWLGRGDYTLGEWETALERAGESWNERTAEYLIRTPLLADYLSEGLATILEEGDGEGE